MKSLYATVGTVPRRQRIMFRDRGKEGLDEERFPQASKNLNGSIQEGVDEILDIIVIK